MKLFFEITSGDREGSRFEIRDGLSIGRKGTDVVLRDPKVSSRHASVEERDHGYYLVDHGSSNGLKIDGNRVNEAHLLPGVAIQLGRTHLLVIDLDEVGQTPEKPIVKTWQDTVLGVIGRMQAALEKQSFQKNARIFAQPIELSAIAGPQTGESWTLVYGPREVGAESLDVRLIGEGIPKIAFELIRSREGLMLKTENADVVAVNGMGGKKDQPLKDGDEISVQSTKLKVKFREL